MAWTEADVATLKQALLDRQGVRTIVFSDQSVTFDSISDMLKLLAIMQAEVDVVAGTSRTRYAATSKGV